MESHLLLKILWLELNPIDDCKSNIMAYLRSDGWGCLCNIWYKVHMRIIRPKLRGICAITPEKNKERAFLKDDRKELL